MFAKKNVVAAAALMAMAAAAQAEVKIYGYLDAAFGSYESFTFNGAGAITTERSTQVSSGNMMTSFIGFAGSEDLGGGLKAEFALESFLATDTGGEVRNMAGGFWGRASWVGLSGGFGRVILGQYDNAFFTLGYTYNPFGSSMVFSPSMVSWYSFSLDPTAFGADANLGYDTGWVNSITYETPNLGGFTAALQFAPKESSGGNEGNKNNYAVSGAYNAGPLSVMAVYTNSGANTNSTAYIARQKNWGLGASYDFGVLKLQGQYAQIKTFDAVSGDEDSKAKFFQIGATVPVTPAGNLLFSYGETKNEFAGVSGEEKLKQFSIGYDHSISKRTGAYVAFSNKKIDSDFVAIDDDSANIFAVGVRHSF
ncbi:porin [Aquabacterium soli]|uniref:Porin n=1 Tax=Aquabacterium soli TaxID=2493092 RepID=A0A426V8J5_9BURK|nr:porin [Aquabacterium soli]RRS03246.1 porin [Aquabacterium soli]